MASTEASTRRLFAAEFLGSAALMLGGLGGAVLAGPALGPLGVAFVFGLTLAALVYALGPISGAHLNPAVSVGMWAARRLNTALLGVYLAAQIFGALLGGLIVYAIARGQDGFSSERNFAANGWNLFSIGRFDLWSVALAEMSLTALLVFVALAVSKRSFPRSAAGLAVGGTFALIYAITAGVDGGAANPARSIASAAFAGKDAIGQAWAFIVFPLIGAFIGVLAWLAVDEARLEDTRLGLGAVEAARDALS